MAKVKVSEWSSTPASNTEIDGINLAEGMMPSDVNNAMREMMSQLKDLQSANPTYYTTNADAIAVGAGGTGAITATDARTNLGAAKSGANSDITSLTGLTSSLTVSQGGTGAATLTGIVKGNGTSAFTAAVAGTDYAGITNVQTFTASQRGTVTTDNDLSFDMAVTNNFSCTPTATGTLTFTNIAQGQSGYVYLDNTGGYAISKAASVLATSTTLTTISAAGKYILAYFAPNGTTVVITSSGVLI